MRTRARSLLTRVMALLMLVAAASRAAEPAPAEDTRQAEIRTTSSGIRYGLWPARPSSPAPTLFILASTIEETLHSDYFRQCGNALAAQGWLCVSIDLPSHGQHAAPGQPSGLAGWRALCEKGEDFVDASSRRLSAVLEALIADGLTDAGRVAACGTSRGGFLALHFAAADPRVKAVATFGQLTDMTMLREFQGIPSRDLASKLALQHQTSRLAGRAIWMVIGDRDERVDTDLAIAFARGVTRESLKAGLDARVELHVLPEPRGHAIPAGSADRAAAWILSVIDQPATLPITPPRK